MNQPQPKKINRIIMLVHPIYSSIFFRPAQPTKTVRRNLSKLLGIWGNEIKKACSEPNTLIVIVKSGRYVFMPKEKTMEKERLKQWFEGKLDGLVGFAEKNAGKRVFVEHWNIWPDFAEKVRAKGFEINRNALKGKSFGEHWKECVNSASACLALSLKIPEGRIFQDPRLSTNSRALYTKEKWPIVEPPERRRKTRLKIRRIKA